MNCRPWLSWALLLCALLSVDAQAVTRAWLDRDRIELGESATLNVESDRPGADAPDFTALQADFEVSGHSSRRSVDLVNGRQQSRALFAVALRPRRDGVFTVPALQVAGESTQPLSLTVLPASTTPARAGQPAFIEASIDTQAPYVQQVVGYVLRLYYATPLVSGQLDQPQPGGASMQRIGSDVQYTREVGGRRYNVVERRFRLIPEASGELTIPGARFEGRGVGGFFDEMFGDGRRDLRANGSPTVLQVRPMPDGAPQPWLPVHALSLRYVSTPQALRAGEAATIEVELIADGAIGAQLPTLQLGPVAGAQVFADPPQLDETVDDGVPRVRMVRKFSLVPAQAGELQVPGPRQAWWDARAGVARTASLPDLRLQVEGGAVTGDVMQPIVESMGTTRKPSLWPWLAVLFAALWLATLAWALVRGTRFSGRRHRSAERGTGEGRQEPQPKPSLIRLMRALQTEDVAAISELLCAMATPPAADLDELLSRLADPTQRDAVAMLQRARWADDATATVAQARSALASAFRSGPVWHRLSVAETGELPPLYPHHRQR